MGRKAKRRGSSVKLWRQQSEKEKRSGTKQTKPNIYTSIQCVISRERNFGQNGITTVSETAHSEEFIVIWKWSQTNKTFFFFFFWYFSFCLGSTAQSPQSSQIPPNWAMSCLTKAYFYNNSIQAGSLSELQAGPENKIEQQRVSIIIIIIVIIWKLSTNSNCFIFSCVQDPGGLRSTVGLLHSHRGLVG